MPHGTFTQKGSFGDLLWGFFALILDPGCERAMAIWKMFTKQALWRCVASPIGAFLGALIVAKVFSPAGRKGVNYKKEETDNKEYGEVWDEVDPAWKDANVVGQWSDALCRRFNRTPLLQILIRVLLVHFLPIFTFVRTLIENPPENDYDKFAAGFLCLHYSIYALTVINCLCGTLCAYWTKTRDDREERWLAYLYSWSVLPLHARVPGPDMGKQDYAAAYGRAWNDASGSWKCEVITILCLVFCMEIPGTLYCLKCCNAQYWWHIVIAVFSVVYAILVFGAEGSVEFDTWTFGFFVHSIWNLIGLTLGCYFMHNIKLNNGDGLNPHNNWANQGSGYSKL